MFSLDDGSAPLVNRKADSSNSSDEDSGTKNANWKREKGYSSSVLYNFCFCVKL